ncbi:Predicted nuclease of the RNAse H fold, HicB family [Methylobacterium sp. 174MFSha1.1]|uniref:type II toxin-antitoxin system HicB family antitoxin n=1 Tax=Methylobacterium sp. 174MFSha1.1 TaxID=1502749 RepID=UPI0008F2E1EA|nr:type II toxin-antitoxin system HicB family antitoxin [Methylobacterium sp. 174MFSha1.1]SFU61465.1 Predicted nuclease of the RNAse H fold, HicB family [Methylobacterium sp. 174MFSha1.1]
MTIMHHGPYQAIVEYDDGAGLFHGEVVNLRDVITFQGRSVDELKQALAESVDDYIEFCRARGEEPEEPFSGHLVVRVDPKTHKAAASAAQRAGISLETWVARTLDAATA